jgi:hypothetical protein
LLEEGDVASQAAVEEVGALCRGTGLAAAAVRLAAAVAAYDSDAALVVLEDLAVSIAPAG